MATAIASMPATVVAKYVTHPIDTIKAKVQVSRLQMRKVTDFKFGQAL